MIARRLLTTLVALLVLGAGVMARPAIANATPDGWIAEDDEEHGWDLSVMFAYHYWPGWGSVGAAVNLGIPIVPSGFTSSLNDAFYIEVDASMGVGLSFWGSDFVNYTMAGVRWQVSLFEWLTVYAAARGGVALRLDAGTDRLFVYGVGGFAVGAIFPFTDFLAARVDLGFPGARAGLTFMF